MAVSVDIEHDPLHPYTEASGTWTTVNTAEAMPGVQTPLGWTFWADGVELGMRGCFYDMGVLKRSEVVAPDSADERYSTVFFGRYAASVDSMRGVGERMLGTDGNAVEEQILGVVSGDKKSQPVYSRYPVVAVKMPLLAARVAGRLNHLREETGVWWRECTSPAALADAAGAPARFAAGRARFQEVMRPHAGATMLAQAMYDQVRALAEKAGLPGLETSLITGYGEMEETRLTADLWDVSRDRLTLEEFVARHGYHGPREGALASKSWREDDSPLRGLVATYKTMPEDADTHTIAKARAAEREQAEAQLLAALAAARRPGARLVLRLAGRYIPMREVGKATFLQAVDVSRAAARTCGAELAATGALDDPEDVFYLTAAELEGTRPANLSDVVAARKARREQHLAVRLPDTWVGHPEPIPIAEPEAEQPDAVSGLAVAPGVVEGRARVVTDPDAGIDIGEGEILVCETTDPSWASFFLVAAAVVIDIGGAMSHGAIVAREMGIPCVINTRIGTQAIKTGDLVRVDGGAGEVRVLERSSD